jgi:2-polyprenyl-6-methoxyphenol hydroxylase-like FAD-dependent oxidoreductase
MSIDHLDVLLVGAGPTGLALALQAAEHGASVRVVERRTEAFRPSRALIVHPRTLEVLRPLGVSDAMLEHGDVAPRAHLHMSSRVVHAQLDALDLPDTAFPHLLLIRQADVEAVLTDALVARGVRIERGTEVTHVSGSSYGAIAHLRDDPERIASRYLVGCDGPDSIVRAAMHTTWTGGPYRHEVLLADVELAGVLEPAAAHAAPGRNGVVFLFALGEHATWRLLATRRARPTGLAFGQPGRPVADDELHELVERSGLPARITAVRWSAQVPLQHRLAGTYRSGPLFLAGDAAHTHSPAGGQGMNTGIQDACNLGWKLAYAARGAPAAETATLLDSYEVERRPVARHVMALTNLAFWAEAGTDPFARGARMVAAKLGPVGLPLLLRRRHVLAVAMRTLGQLRVRYRHSPLSRDGRRHANLPRPGDRLPDGPVTTCEGATRLHRLTARPGVHVFLRRDAVIPYARSIPRDAHLHRLRDQPGTGLFAVRPDGYVGFAGDHADGDALAGWFALLGSGAPPGPSCDPETVRPVT